MLSNHHGSLSHHQFLSGRLLLLKLDWVNKLSCCTSCILEQFAKPGCLGSNTCSGKNGVTSKGKGLILLRIEPSGVIKVKKTSHYFVTHPTQVILPLSPTGGSLFGLVRFCTSNLPLRLGNSTGYPRVFRGYFSYQLVAHSCDQNALIFTGIG